MDRSESGHPILYFPPVSKDIPPTSILISNNLNLAYFKDSKECDLSNMSAERHSLFVETQGEQIEAGVKECIGDILGTIIGCAEDQKRTGRIWSSARMLENYHSNQAHLQQQIISQPLSPYSERYCENCKFDEEMIESRNGVLNNDNLGFHYHKNWRRSKLSCFSCILIEINKEGLGDNQIIDEDVVAVCEGCGLCELMEDIDGETLEGTFTQCFTELNRPFYWLCAQCYGTDDSVYEGEFENEDLPEDNSEKMNKIKDIVKEAGVLVFDIQDKITEGEYLKLMDSLQEITNEANSL